MEKGKNQEEHYFFCLDEIDAKAKINRIEKNLDNNFASLMKDADFIDLPLHDYLHKIHIKFMEVSESEFKDGCLIFLPKAYLINSKVKIIKT